MAGHSHWAGIKHKKGAADAKRGKLFSKLSKYITIAAREGGGDPDMNVTLKYAVDRAKAQNMPKDVIERAIKKGTGELEGVSYAELLYEGFGPENVAVVLDILTDNRNRTASELRKIFERRGGNLASPGSVGWMFETKGVFQIPITAISEEDLMELILEAGGEDLVPSTDCYEVRTPPEAFNEVKQVLNDKNLPMSYAAISRLPTTTVEVTDAKSARKVVEFVTELEEHDDVQNVSANFDIPEEILAQLEE